MPTPADPLDELRRHYCDATSGPRGRWTAEVAQRSGQTHVDGIEPDGGRWLVTLANKLTDGRLMAAARNPLPLPFRALDDARAARTVPVLGDVVAGGAVAWRSPPAGPVTAGAAPAA